MSVAAAPTRRRPSRLPQLLAILTLGAAIAAVVIGQGYRSVLTDSLARLQASVLQAQVRAQTAAERAREAEAALAAQRARQALDAPVPQTAERLRATAADLERLAVGIASRAASQPPPDPRRVQAALAELTRAAQRLPPLLPAPTPGVPLLPPPLPIGPGPVQVALGQAQLAIGNGDRVQAVQALDAAARLLGMYQNDPRARGLALRLERLRAGLGASAELPAALRLERLATELRGLAAGLRGSGGATPPGPAAVER